jgi:hypothetical protein
LDSEEVCVKLDNGLTEIIVSSICFSDRNFCELCLQKIPWRTKLASIRGSYYITFNV